MVVEAVNGSPLLEISNDYKDNKVQPKTEPYPNDSIELSTTKQKEKKKHSLLKKTLIGVGSALAATIGLALLIVKHQGNRIKKLYDEKLVLSNLKEKIDFVEAKTVDEGIKFAKDILGIKEVDNRFTLEAINAANRGLVDVANAHKGKVFMPHALRFTSPRRKNDYIAAVQMNINSQEFGHMYINRHYFDPKFLDDEIKSRLFDKSGKHLFKFDTNMEYITQMPVWDKYILANPTKDVAKLIKKFYQTPADLTVSEKRELFYSLSYGKDNARKVFRTPVETLRTIERTQREFLNNNNIHIDYDELSKLSYKEQKQKLIDILEKMKTNNLYLEKDFNLFSPINTIHHEMGHLQDAAKNLKELDLKQWKFDWKGEWNSIRNKGKSGEITSRSNVQEVDNRWGSVWDGSLRNFYLKYPEKFKEKYPDLYEFIENKNIQQSVGKISAYSQSGIGEFIAETYAKMIAKQTIPDDVMALYRKYKGPEFAAAA